MCSSSGTIAFFFVLLHSRHGAAQITMWCCSSAANRCRSGQSNNVTATRLQFSYDNSTIYPGGNYKGTVRFTASME